MRKIILTLILSFAILSCETPNEESNSDLPTVIDDTELVAIADAMYEAMNSDDVDSVLNFYADEASWSFPNGVNIEGKEAIGQMLATTTSIWNITREEGTNYLALEGTNESGEDFKVLPTVGHVRHLPSKNGSVKPEEDFSKESFHLTYIQKESMLRNFH